MEDKVLAGFTEEMWWLYRESLKRFGYNASYFREMLEERGPISTARHLAGSPGHHEGLTKLYELGALDLSVEALIQRRPWRELFDERTLAAARKKLLDLNYSESDGGTFPA